MCEDGFGIRIRAITVGDAIGLRRWRSMTS